MDNLITSKVWLDKLSKPNTTQLEFLDLQKVFSTFLTFLQQKKKHFYLFT